MMEKILIIFQEELGPENIHLVVWDLSCNKRKMDDRDVSFPFERGKAENELQHLGKYCYEPAPTLLQSFKKGKMDERDVSFPFDGGGQHLDPSQAKWRRFLLLKDPP